MSLYRGQTGLRGHGLVSRIYPAELTKRRHGDNIFDISLIDIWSFKREFTSRTS